MGGRGAHAQGACAVEVHQLRAAPQLRPIVIFAAKPRVAGGRNEREVEVPGVEVLLYLHVQRPLLQRLRCMCLQGVPSSAVEKLEDPQSRHDGTVNAEMS